jgi:peptide/nickel transport system substrate-binding protein
MKWSDGEPVTADDLLFWWEDIVNNEDIVANVPTIWRPGGTPMAVTKVDDFTVEFEFAVPYRFFQFYLTEMSVRQMPLRPRHYLEQFHIDYNPDATELAQEQNFDEWYELFGERGGALEPAFHENPDLPVLFPWTTVQYEPDIWVGERNPYYWRVDTEGNQLPYIDRVQCDISTNREVLTAKVVAGQVDYSAVVIPFSDIPLMKDSEEKGNFTTHLWDVPMGTMPSINVNQTYPEEEDAVLRKIFKDDRFRQALSVAIDREEANKVAYFGLSYPTQLTALPGSRWEEDEYRNAYADYDPDRANDLLDDMGLEWDNNNEWRMRPDGKTLSIVMETIDVGAIRGYSKILPLIKEYWEAVGVKTTLKTLEPALWGSRLGANQLQVTMWGVDSFNDLTFQILGPWLIPGTSYGGSTWHAMGWQQWATSDGEEGEEPPEDVKRMMELWDEMRSSTDQDEITRFGKEIFALQAEHVYIIGVVGSVRQALVVSNDLGNFPTDGVWANPTSLAGYAWAFQWYFKD